MHVATKTMRMGVLALAVLVARPGEAAGQTVEARLGSVMADVEALTARLDLAMAGLDPRLELVMAEVDAVASQVHAATARLAAVPWPVFALQDEASAAQAPEAWLPQDPADSLYRAAREALNRRDYARSAGLFAQIRGRYPRSGYVADSYYFQALALERSGDVESLEEALGLLDAMLARHADAPTAGDARTLRVRIQGALARRGDADAAARVAQQATGDCDGEDQRLRGAAMSALLHMDSDRAAPLLREVLRSRDRCSAELRKQAVFILSQKMDGGTVELLLDLAHRDPDPDPEVREAAVFWLSQVRSEEALDALESILASADANRQIQEKAVFAVSQHRSPRALEILKAYAERPDAPKNLRENAIFWIGQSQRAGGADYLRQLYGRLRDPELKEKVVFGVAQSRSEANGRWLMERAKDASESVELRKHALFWAGRMGVVTVADLRELYDAMPDPELKEQVVFVLSQKRGPEAVDALMTIAREEDDAELREKAVFWLGQSRDPRVPEFLMSLIRGGA